MQQVELEGLIDFVFVDCDAANGTHRYHATHHKLFQTHATHCELMQLPCKLSMWVGAQPSPPDFSMR